MFVVNCQEYADNCENYNCLLLPTYFWQLSTSIQYLLTVAQYCPIYATIAHLSQLVQNCLLFYLSTILVHYFAIWKQWTSVTQMSQSCDIGGEWVSITLSTIATIITHSVLTIVNKYPTFVYSCPILSNICHTCPPLPDNYLQLSTSIQHLSTIAQYCPIYPTIAHLSQLG